MTTHKSPPNLKIWKCRKEIPFPVYCEKVTHDSEGLKFLLKSKKNEMLQIRFPYVWTYHVAQEGLLLKDIGLFPDNDFATIYIVENSNYIEWLHEQSLGTNRNVELTHYAIETLSDHIAVIAAEEPIIKRIKK